MLERFSFFAYIFASFPLHMKKSPESHLWIQGIFSIPHSRQNVQLSKSVSKTPSGVFIVRIPRLKLSSETVI